MERMKKIIAHWTARAMAAADAPPGDGIIRKLEGESGNEIFREGES